jgi:uncharacterized integral membrane protein
MSDPEKDVRQPAPAPKHPPSADPQAGARESLDWLRFGLIAAAILYALILLLLNNDKIELDFLFFSANTRLWLLLLLTLVLGFVAGYGAARLYDRRRRSAGR